MNNEDGDEHFQTELNSSIVNIISFTADYLDKVSDAMRNKANYILNHNKTVMVIQEETQKEEERLKKKRKREEEDLKGIPQEHRESYSRWLKAMKKLS